MFAPRCARWNPASILAAVLTLSVLAPCYGQTAGTAKPSDRPKAAQPAKANLPAKPATTKTPGFAEATDKAKAKPSVAADKAAPKKVETPKPGKPVETAKAPAKPQAPAPKPEPPKDPDLAFQGEFVGSVVATPAQFQRVALQVRPTGTGGFDAMQYQGGLPGEPSHRPASISLVGKRWERFLVLSGGPWAIFVEPDQCVLFDRQGQRVGRLERIVRVSPTLGAAPPREAIVLFDGKGTRMLTTARMTADGLLMEGADARPLFQDFNLHVEFLLPYMPSAKDQSRANSGVYLQSRYEIQILDSFAQVPVYNGCGSIYRFRKPDLNMCLPSQVWQTYDIAFTAPRWLSDGTKWRNGRVTVWLNGVKVQNDVELLDKTGAGKVEDPLPLPIRFQDHRNPVRFRNIWIVDRGALAPVGFPALAKPAQPAAQPAKKPHGDAKPTQQKP